MSHARSGHVPSSPLRIKKMYKTIQDGYISPEWNDACRRTGIVKRGEEGASGHIVEIEQNAVQISDCDLEDAIDRRTVCNRHGM